MRTLTAALVIVALFTSACGKSAEQKKAEEAAAAVSQSANDMAKAMQGMASAVSGSADGKPVETLPFQTLQTHLPKVSGFEMDEPEGSRMNMPVPFSQVGTTYKKGDARIELKIVDTGYAQMLVMPWNMMLASGYSRETSDGYEKATSIGGNPAIEKWNKTSKEGELDVLVGKRFMVTIEGHDIDGIKQLQDFASNVNFGAIAAAK